MEEPIIPSNPDEFPLSEKEQLRMENEILRLKIKAELGGEFGGSENLPPEVENQFLKNVLAFENQQSELKAVKVSKLLGDPVFTKQTALSDLLFDSEWNRLNELLNQKSIAIDFIRPRENRFKYQFITEELFDHETDTGMMMPGMILHFIYEEFHPDHEQEITDCTIEFLKGWFDQKIEPDSGFLHPNHIQADGNVLSREELVQRIQAMFDSYTSFENGKYKILEVKFQLQKDANSPMEGIGHSEGMMSYEGILETGESVQIEGPFKFYLTQEFGWWSIYFFYVPGFNS